jgi:hypothetical protein
MVGIGAVVSSTPEAPSLTEPDELILAEGDITIPPFIFG